MVFDLCILFSLRAIDFSIEGTCGIRHRRYNLLRDVPVLYNRLSVEPEQMHLPQATITRP